MKSSQSSIKTLPSFLPSFLPSQLLPLLLPPSHQLLQKTPLPPRLLLLADPVILPHPPLPLPLITRIHARVLIEPDRLQPPRAMLQLRWPTHLISLVAIARQDPRRFEVVDEELGPQTVGGDCVRFVQRVSHLGGLREQFLGFVVGGGGGGCAGAVRVEGAVIGGVDGHFIFRGIFGRGTMSWCILGRRNNRFGLVRKPR